MRPASGRDKYPLRRRLAALLLRPVYGRRIREEILDDLEDLRARRLEDLRARRPKEDPLAREPGELGSRRSEKSWATWRYWLDIFRFVLAFRSIPESRWLPRRDPSSDMHPERYRPPLLRRLEAGLESVISDIRFTIRSYLRTPLPSLVILGTVGLALGANTAIFSFADALFLRPLPVPQPERLVVLFHQAVEEPDRYSSFSYPDFVELREQNDGLEGLAAYASVAAEVGSGRSLGQGRGVGQGYGVGQRSGVGQTGGVGRENSVGQTGGVGRENSVGLGSSVHRASSTGQASSVGHAGSTGQGGGTETVATLMVSANYFSVMGKEPPLGRSFLPEEDRSPGTHPVVVVSHSFWKDRLNGEASALGSDLVLNGRPFTIIGVAAADMPAPDLESEADLWVPLMMHRTLIPDFQINGIELFYNRGTHWLGLLGRLDPAVSLEAAEASVRSVAAQQASSNPETNADWSIAIVPATRARTGDPSNRAPQMITGLLAAVVLMVLLIACANVANLLLARAQVRRQEMGMRLALGAGRGRLVRQVLTESVLLSLAGSFLGLLIAFWSSDILRALGATVGPAAPDLRMDGRVTAFALGLALLTALAFGILPAFQASTSGITWARGRPGAGSGVGRRNRLIQQGLIVLQVAVSLVLLVAAGLTLRTVWNLGNVPLGFDVAGVRMVSLDLRQQDLSAEEGWRVQQAVMERLREQPGIEAVSLARVTPFGLYRMANDIFWENGGADESANRTNVDLNAVGPGFFQTLGIPIVDGRGFTREDGPGTPGVAVVNRALAERLWPGESAVGKRIWSWNPNGPNRELRVVGVAENGRYYRSWRSADQPFYFRAIAQDYASTSSLLVRTQPGWGQGDAELAGMIQDLVPGIPTPRTTSLSAARAESMARETTTARLLGLFGILAASIAAMGIYGVVSFSVTRRQHEIGVRIAVGASGKDVGRIILKHGVIPVLVGLALGVLVALPTSRIITGLLYGIEPTDPLLYVGMTVFLASAGLLASLIPARRATRVDPLKILNAEG